MRKSVVAPVVGIGAAVALYAALAGGGDPAPVSIDPVIAAVGTVEVHKSATCGCCGDHVTYLEEAGFEVDVTVHEDNAGVSVFKEELEVPEHMWSCHTSLIDGYAIEGHVPVDVILELLDERPEVDGIALPGMELGSPGMNGEKDKTWVFPAFAGGEELDTFAIR